MQGSDRHLLSHWIHPLTRKPYNHRPHLGRAASTTITTAEYDRRSAKSENQNSREKKENLAHAHNKVHPRLHCHVAYTIDTIDSQCHDRRLILTHMLTALQGTSKRRLGRGVTTVFLLERSNCIYCGHTSSPSLPSHHLRLQIQ